MKPYPIPAKISRTEIMVSNSRFIATAGPVFSAEEARAFILSVRQEFADATHNVPAFIIGFGASTMEHCSDDGEPAGTAGRPALTVLKGSGLGDIAVVVTRYFGGTKLGTGGLVRAYTDAVKAVLDGLPRARKVRTCTAMMVIGYRFFERTRDLIRTLGGEILGEEFAADITLTARFVEDDFPSFQSALVELTGGNAEIEIIEINPGTILPEVI